MKMNIKSRATETVGKDIPTGAEQVTTGQQPPPPNPPAVKPVMMKGGKPMKGAATKKKPIRSIGDLKAVAAQFKAKSKMGY